MALCTPKIVPETLASGEEPDLPILRTISQYGCMCRNDGTASAIPAESFHARVRHLKTHFAQ